MDTIPELSKINSLEIELLRATIQHYIRFHTAATALNIKVETTSKDYLINAIISEIQKNWESINLYPAFTIEKKVAFINANPELIKILNISLAFDILEE